MEVKARPGHQQHSNLHAHVEASLQETDYLQQEKRFPSWVHSGQAHISLKLPVALLHQINALPKNKAKSVRNKEGRAPMIPSDPTMFTFSLSENMREGFSSQTNVSWVCQLQASHFWEQLNSHRRNIRLYDNHSQMSLPSPKFCETPDLYIQLPKTSLFLGGGRSVFEPRTSCMGTKDVLYHWLSFSTCCQSWWPEINPWNPHGGENWLHTSCPLTSTQEPTQRHTHT